VQHLPSAARSLPMPLLRKSYAGHPVSIWRFYGGIPEIWSGIRFLEDPVMDLDLVLGGLASARLFVYLLAVLLRPERF